jgi:hypothetical protein
VSGRFCCLVTTFFLAITSLARALATEAPYINIEATVELHGEAPYVGEPLRLVVRSAIHAKVANDRIIQPDLTNFDWQQFGVDTVTEEFIDGFWMPVITRVLMIYPLQPGKLSIGAFRRHVTYFGLSGERLEIDITSKPLTLDVQSHESISVTKDFWIPARSFLITDEWSPEPDQISFGETTLRTITIKAEGLTADRLPNLPPLRAPGIITFASPVHRETIITDRGPLGLAVYRWRIRPASQAVALAPSIKIRWFDVLKRQMRDAVVPERRVAFLPQGETIQTSQKNGFSIFLSGRSIMAFLLAFLITGISVFLLVSVRYNDPSLWRSFTGSLPLFIFLFTAALQNDKLRFYELLYRLKKTDPATWKIIEDHPEHSALIEDLEPEIYGHGSMTESLGLIRRALYLFKIYLTARMRTRSKASVLIK